MLISFSRAFQHAERSLLSTTTTAKQIKKTLPAVFSRSFSTTIDSSFFQSQPQYTSTLKTNNTEKSQTEKITFKNALTSLNNTTSLFSRFLSNLVIPIPSLHNILDNKIILPPPQEKQKENDENTAEGTTTTTVIIPSIYLIKRTYQPSVIKRKRTHGFLSRLKTRGGRDIINRRKAKGRKNIAP
eukprot:TRINITY_DN4410_c0_g1_i2.p1 TRINITY_DN4410_c0_g1~~TRINITY_DN4410_c0_g1_i2.p1  ORF type:complete len:185 (-),score=32.67 TRINITY_DN4410_c0_g1_i2:8-562(-)